MLPDLSLTCLNLALLPIILLAQRSGRNFQQHLIQCIVNLRPELRGLGREHGHVTRADLFDKKWNGVIEIAVDFIFLSTYPDRLPSFLRYMHRCHLAPLDQGTASYAHIL